MKKNTKFTQLQTLLYEKQDSDVSKVLSRASTASANFRN